MLYRVWIADDMTAITNYDLNEDNCAVLENVDDKGLTLLITFMQHQRCALAILPTSCEEEG